MNRFIDEIVNMQNYENLLIYEYYKFIITNNVRSFGKYEYSYF